MNVLSFKYKRHVLCPLPESLLFHLSEICNVGTSRQFFMRKVCDHNFSVCAIRPYAIVDVFVWGRVSGSLATLCSALREVLLQLLLWQWQKL